jgi:transposase-like protein
MKLIAKQKAVSLRRQGYSIKEIAHQVSVSQSTASLWARDVVLEAKARARLQSRVRLGVLVSAQRQLATTKSERDHFLRLAWPIIESVGRSTPEQAKLCTALIYWCEGAKSADNVLKFANSDPALVRFFLAMLKRGFDVKSDKFRAMIHLHDYHDERKQIAFWSKLTGIPPKQFYKSYRKPHTGVRQRTNYQGCITINYYDKLVAREVFGLMSALSGAYM